MAEHSSERTTIAGCEIELLRGGDGPPLVFLHGAGGAHNWMPYGPVGGALFRHRS